MKFLHLSDLHLGKRVNQFSMLEDQAYILTKIINIIDQENPEAVLICGDIYDKTVPSAEAVSLFDNFLVRLASRDLKIFVLSGNHDSPERLAFGAKLMSLSGVFMSPVYQNDIMPTVLSDPYGDICVYMLPFIKPVQVRPFFPEREINSYQQAVEVAISALPLDLSKRNILLTHQFITGSERSESEEISVGGTDNIGAETLAAFDYVALGHLHKAQHIGRETLRYCGSPLKYSFSEINHQKSVTIIEMLAKTQIEVRTIPLIAKRDLVEIKGHYRELMAKSYYENLNVDNYYHIILTDEQDEYDALNKLRTVYPNIMKLSYDNARTKSNSVLVIEEENQHKSPLSLVEEFYQLQNNLPLTFKQREVVSELISEIWEGAK